MALAALLVGCGGGGSDAAPDLTQGLSSDTAATAPSALVRLDAEPAGVNCAAGGTSVNAGLDTNGDGILQASETTSTGYVCNAVAGASGSAGVSTLVTTANEPAGSNCANGGSRISAGKDANGNGVLEAGEVSAVSFVCSGANGSNGAAGVSGRAGATGATGAAGLSSLLAVAAEPNGANCTYGGQKVTAGLDANANGALDASEVTTTTYLCNGAPGPDLHWIDVTGTAAQTQANTGYLADNPNSRVTLTLPASPAIGDIVRISGAGAGGWSIAQNAGQSIRLPASLVSGRIAWSARTGAGLRAWQSVAQSTDGSHLVAVAASGEINTSADAGVTWVAQGGAPQITWYSVASSADGSHLAVAGGNTVYTSVDFGVTWVQAGISIGQWLAIASSADGSHLVAVDNNDGYISTSPDGGATWTLQTGAGQNFWLAVTSSADGSRLAATANSTSDYVYTSSDYGVTWTAQTGIGQGWWYSIASDTTGMRLVTANHLGGSVYTSVDGGQTWVQRSGAGPRSWGAVTSSADGSRLAAADSNNGWVYASTDAGNTWLAQTSLGQENWQALSSSADGYRLLALDTSNDAIYTGAYRYTTTTGPAGSLQGAQYDAVELQAVGNGTFMVLSASVDAAALVAN